MERGRSFGRNTTPGHLWAVCQAELLKYRRRQLGSILTLAYVNIDINTQILNSKDPKRLRMALKFDYHTAFEAALATQVYEGIPTPWTTTEYAFQPFSLATGSQSGKITTNTTAYSAYLDCRSYSQSEVTTVESAEATTSSIAMLVEDRGCPVTHTVYSLAISTLYGVTFTTQNCTLDSVSSRVGLIAAGFGPNARDQLSSLTLKSCTLSYWQTSGNLSVAVASDKYPINNSFSPNPKH